MTPRDLHRAAADTVVVVDTYSGQVTLIDTRTGHASPPIQAGSYPVAVAIGR